MKSYRLVSVTIRPDGSLMRPPGYEAMNPRVARSKSPSSIGVETAAFLDLV
jgi:hypothetical protein